MTVNGYPAVSWSDTLDLQRSALRWDIKRTMKSLCKKLEEIGEECFVVTVNVHNGWIGHLGSIRGDEYIDQKSNILYDFLNFCQESLDNDGIQEKDEEDDSSDATLFPSSEDNSKVPDDQLISISRPEPCNSDEIPDEDPISVQMPERYSGMRFAKISGDTSFNKLFFVSMKGLQTPVQPVVVSPVSSSSPQTQPAETEGVSNLTQTDSTQTEAVLKQVPEPRGRFLPVDISKLHTSGRLLQVAPLKVNRRKRKQTFKRRLEGGSDSDDSEYKIDKRLLAKGDVPVSAPNTRRLRSSSSARKAERLSVTGDENSDSESDTDSKDNIKKLKLEDDWEQNKTKKLNQDDDWEPETEESSDVTDESDEDWEEDMPVKRSGKRKSKPLSKGQVQRQLPRGLRIIDTEEVSGTEKNEIKKEPCIHIESVQIQNL